MNAGVIVVGLGAAGSATLYQLAQHPEVHRRRARYQVDEGVMVELRSTPRQSDEVIVYYVKRGDTWWRLAKSYTGRGTNWPAVEAAAKS
jgi:nucleoid-associated protein YgaU